MRPYGTGVGSPFQVVSLAAVPHESSNRYIPAGGARSRAPCGRFGSLIDGVNQIQQTLALNPTLLQPVRHRPNNIALGQDAHDLPRFVHHRQAVYVTFLQVLGGFP